MSNSDDYGLTQEQQKYILYVARHIQPIHLGEI